MDKRELCADIVRRMISAGASDLHIAPGQRIQMRVDGVLVPEQCIPDSDAVDALLERILSAEQRAALCTRDIDFAWTYAGRRFRVNAVRGLPCAFFPHASQLPWTLACRRCCR